MTETLAELCAAAAAGVSWIMIVARTIEVVRDPGNSARYVLLVSVTAAAVTLTVHAYTTHAAARFGPFGSGRLLSDCSVIVALAAAHLYLDLRNRSGARSLRTIGIQAAVAALVVAALVLLYFTVPPTGTRVWISPVEPAQHRRAIAGRHALYTLLLLMYVFIMLIRIAVLSSRYTLYASRPLLRLGLRAVTTGTVLGIIAVELDIVRTILALGWRVMSAWTAPFSSLLLSAASLLMLGGATLPSWGPLLGLQWIVTRCSAMRACSLLRPLWGDLRSRVQLLSTGADIALLPEASNILERFTQAPVRLVRLVAELSESIRLLADARDADVARRAAQAARAAGLNGLPLDAAVEAAILAAIARGGPAPAAPAPLPVPPADATDIGLADDFLAKDAAWLLAVATAYRRTRPSIPGAPVPITTPPAA